MPTDPVQVVAEAPCIRMTSWANGTCDGEGRRTHPECAVAALKAAGALMPEEAEAYNDGAADNYELVEQRIFDLEALLQEALSVLGRHQLSFTPASRGDHKGKHFCIECTNYLDDFPLYVDWPCPEASLAEKIEKAIGGEG